MVYRGGVCLCRRVGGGMVYRKGMAVKYTVIGDRDDLEICVEWVEAKTIRGAIQVVTSPRSMDPLTRVFCVFEGYHEDQVCQVKPEGTPVTYEDCYEGDGCVDL